MPSIAPLLTAGAGRGTSAARATGAATVVLVLAATLCPAAELTRRPAPAGEAGWERAAADTVIVAPTADAAAVWSRTMQGFSATHPVARAIEPDAASRPPRPGTIESVWVEVADGPRQPTWPHWPTERERIVVHVVPTSAGTVVMGAVERRSFAGGAPAFAPLPDEFVGNVVQTAGWEDASAGDSPRGLPAAVPPGDGFYEPVVEDALGLESDPPWSHAAHPRLAGAVYRVTDDYLNFYGCRSLAGIGIATGVAAIMANTTFDASVQASWQRNVSPTGFGDFLSGCRDIGNGFYAVPIFGAAATLCFAGAEHPALYAVGEWGARSLRAVAVGAPFMLLMQEATGASRPGESPSGSRWKPFNDNNGVSGHAFMGAIPFLAAAEMVERPLLKGALYVCSTFTAFSRMTDDQHYPSQAFLGWYLALAASQAVDTTEARIADMEFRVVPLTMAGLNGLGVEGRW
jgi:hypothetical protein